MLDREREPGELLVLAQEDEPASELADACAAERELLRRGRATLADVALESQALAGLVEHAHGLGRAHAPRELDAQIAEPDDHAAAPR